MRRLALATVLALVAAGCGDEQPDEPPPRVLGVLATADGLQLVKERDGAGEEALVAVRGLKPKAFARLVPTSGPPLTDKANGSGTAFFRLKAAAREGRGRLEVREIGVDLGPFDYAGGDVLAVRRAPR
jgi:hypothetical protein